MGSAPGHAAQFVLIGANGAGGVHVIESSVRPALSAKGRVAFVGSLRPPAGSGQAIFVGDGGSLTHAATAAAGYAAVQSVQIAGANQVAFGNNPSPPDATNGVYRTDATGSFFTVVHQSAQPKYRQLRMSSNGTLVFSDIVNGSGALYRAPPGQPPELLRQGTGTYYNTGQLDVDNDGRVVAQMEYLDPIGQLRRGVLVFDTPGDTLQTVETTVERANVAVQAPVAINNQGQVAFTLNLSVTIQYYTPPFPGGGTPSGTLQLDPGVYVATPTAFGTPFTFQRIAGSAYTDFGNVDINDQGLVVFEATAGGRRGLFTGKNPKTDAIVVAGLSPASVWPKDLRGATVRLGQLNNANQVSFVATAAPLSKMSKVWRADLDERGR